MQFYIETERLILRDLLPEDAEGMYELDSDSEVHRYVGGRPVQSIEQCKQVINIIREQYQTNGIGRWAVIEKQTGAFIGWSGLKLMKEVINGHSGHYDVGYRFIRRFWGKGYATEAAQAAVKYAWQVLKANEVFAIADKKNAASRHVLEKIGMLCTDEFEYDGADHDWFELKRPEFIYQRGNAVDVAKLKAIGIAAYSEYEHVLTPDNWQTLKTNLYNDERWQALVKSAQIFVCTKEEEIIGAAYLVPAGNPTPVFDEDWCYIRMVGVLPQYRGYGVARQLTKMCIEHAGQANERTIALHTSEFMDSARHLYESLGFRKMKEIDPIFGKRYWLYTLEI